MDCKNEMPFHSCNDLENTVVILAHKQSRPEKHFKVEIFFLGGGAAGSEVPPIFVAVYSSRTRIRDDIHVLSPPWHGVCCSYIVYEFTGGVDAFE